MTRRHPGPRPACKGSRRRRRGAHPSAARISDGDVAGLRRVPRRSGWRTYRRGRRRLVPSAELAILVLVGTGTIAGLVLYMLWPDKPPLPPEEAINESIAAQQWAAAPARAGPPALPSHPPFG